MKPKANVVKIHIYKRTDGEWSWRMLVGRNVTARMPDGTATPWKVKRAVQRLAVYSGPASPIRTACLLALEQFERTHPTRRRSVQSADGSAPT